jgi:toxin-antitoxin system PIN domain toxin
MVVCGYLRIATNAKATPRPISVAAAVADMRTLLSEPNVVIVDPDDVQQHLDNVDSLLEPLGAGGNLISDAHIAALAMEHDAEVVSYDADFGRFPGVRWRKPSGTGARNEDDRPRANLSPS